MLPVLLSELVNIGLAAFTDDPTSANPCDYQTPKTLEECWTEVLNCRDCCLAAGRHAVPGDVINSPEGPYILGKKVGSTMPTPTKTWDNHNG